MKKMTHRNGSQAQNLKSINFFKETNDERSFVQRPKKRMWTSELDVHSHGKAAKLVKLDNKISKLRKQKYSVKGDKFTTVDFNIDAKPNWAKVKILHKELKETRKKQHNEHYEVIKQSKKLWEELRRTGCSPSKQKELVKNLFKLLKGKIGNVVRSHDMSRVVQCMIKKSSVEMVHSIIDELLECVVSLAQAKYAAYTVKCIIKHGNNSIRKKIISYFLGHTVKLLSNTLSVELIARIYARYASVTDKIYMRQELYGDLYKGVKNDKIVSLSSAFQESPEMKDGILGTTKYTLTKLIDKKLPLRSSLVHHVLYDYLNHCNDTDKAEMMVILKDFVSSLATSICGCKIVMLIIWNSTNKIKKQILKEMKPYLNLIAKDKNAHLLILALIDSVDDTVFLKQVLLTLLVINGKELANDEYGRKVILYLVAHRNTKYFHPAVLKHFQNADESVYTKKNCEQRMNELLEPTCGILICKIREDPGYWFSNGRIGMVTLAILKSSSQEMLGNTLQLVVDYIVREDSVVTESGKCCNIIHHSGLHMIFKQLISHEKLNFKTSEGTFSHYLVQKLDEDILSRWLKQNKGCFLLVCILEGGISDLKILLKNKLCEIKVKQILDEQTSTGGLILKKLIDTK